MPLYEYECLKCRKNLEESLKKLKNKIMKKSVSDLVKKHYNIHYILVVDLDKKKILAESGKKDSGSVDTYILYRLGLSISLWSILFLYVITYISFCPDLRGQI